MPQPAYTVYILLLLCMLTCCHLYAQESNANRFDTAYYQQFHLQSFRNIIGNTDSNHLRFLSLKRPELKWKDSAAASAKPGRAFSSQGGNIIYEYQYLSLTDTPYTEKNISQHLISAEWAVTLADKIPLQVRANIRRSNSSLFRNFADFQVSFDAAAYRQMLISGALDKLEKLKNVAEDSLQQINSILQQWREKITQYKNIDALLKQKALEAKEVISVPPLAYEDRLPDSLNVRRADTVITQAKAFLAWYGRIKNYGDSIVTVLDSLNDQKEAVQEKIRQYKGLLAGAQHLPVERLRSQVLDSSERVRPKGIAGFMGGVQQFGLGRINVDHSELTVRNISLTGINLAYQSWFYAAFTAGLIDYRFRDFYSRQYARPRQHFMMARLGIGQTTGRRLIFSVYHGQKQWFSSVSSSVSYPVTGYSIEGQWQLLKQVQVTAEAAQSFSPDYRSQPLKTDHRWSLSDASNKALFLKAYGYFQRTQTRFDLRYRYTGERFQSFSRLQSFTALRSWSAKADQSVWKRRVRLSLAAYSNDFSSPFLQQQYSSRSVMKSAQASFYLPHWPVISIGYLPLSQVTRIADEWVENHFQILTGSLFHQYRIGRLKAASNISLSRYYNRPQDTALLYYQALNVYASQLFYFTGVNVNLSLSYNKVPDYSYVVLEEGVNWPLSKNISIDGGLSINQFNGMKAKLGAYTGGTILLRNNDRLSFRVDQAYYPADTKMLYDRVTGTIQFIKSF